MWGIFYHTGTDPTNLVNAPNVGGHLRTVKIVNPGDHQYQLAHGCITRKTARFDESRVLDLRPG